MAKAELTGNRVQGRPEPTDALDRLIAIAAEIADRTGLLDESLAELDAGMDATENTAGGSSGETDDRRSA